MKNIYQWKSGTVGGVFFLLGISMFVDCWLELTGSCNWEAKSYIAGCIVFALVFLFMDEATVKQNIQALFNWLLRRGKE